MPLPAGYGGFGGEQANLAPGTDNPELRQWWLRRQQGLPQVGVAPGQPVGVNAVPQPVPNPQAQQGPPEFAPGQGLPALPVPPRPAPEPAPSSPFQGNEIILPMMGGRRRIVNNYKTDAQGNQTPFTQEIQEYGPGAKAPEGDYGPLAQMADPRSYIQNLRMSKVGVQPPPLPVGVPVGGMAAAMNPLLGMAPAAMASQQAPQTLNQSDMQAMDEIKKSVGYQSGADKAFAQQQSIEELKQKTELAKTAIQAASVKHGSLAQAATALMGQLGNDAGGLTAAMRTLRSLVGGGEDRNPLDILSPFSGIFSGGGFPAPAKKPVAVNPSPTPGVTPPDPETVENERLSAVRALFSDPSVVTRDPSTKPDVPGIARSVNLGNFLERAGKDTRVMSNMPDVKDQLLKLGLHGQNSLERELAIEAARLARESGYALNGEGKVGGMKFTEKNRWGVPFGLLGKTLNIQGPNASWDVGHGGLLSGKLSGQEDWRPTISERTKASNKQSLEAASALLKALGM